MPTCNTCGTYCKTQLALRSHEGSKPCQVAVTVRRMEKAGWARVQTGTGMAAVKAAESVDWEEAPSEYSAGGMLRGVVGSTMTSQTRTVTQFQPPRTHNAVWAPAWAAEIADSAVEQALKIAVLHHLGYNGSEIAATLTTLRLGGPEAVEALGRDWLAAAEEES
jgi:hypothetical protein